MAVWRSGCETVCQMHQRRWDIITKCRRCGLQLHANLRMVIKVNGPNFSLWNRRAPCRKVGCGGMVEFMGKPPGCGMYRALVVEGGAG